MEIPSVLRHLMSRSLTALTAALQFTLAIKTEKESSAAGGDFKLCVDKTKVSGPNTILEWVTTVANKHEKSPHCAKK